MPPNEVLMCSFAHHVTMIIAYHHIRCTVYIFTYAIASYRIVGGVASSSSGGADRVRSTRSSDTGGVWGRQARRGSTWVCGPPTQFLRTRQAQEHSKSPTYKRNYLYIWVCIFFCGYMSMYIVALSYRSWVKPLMHLLLSLPTWQSSYPDRFRIGKT
jgi:hypothetical protein